jgi:hypothetical protein
LVLAVLLLGAMWVVGSWALPASLALTVLTRAGYWLVLAAFIIWVWSLTKVLPKIWRTIQWTPADRWCAVGIGLAGTLLLVHEPPGFKILMDEIHLLGTSMAMHWERAVFVPQRANDLQGIFELMIGMVDKRPTFFPFLLCTLHDLTGYRPENAFVLNGILTFGLLGFSYLAGRALAGWRGGLVAVIAWTALPLLGQNASGGGFEILNVVMILATALLAGWYYRARDDWSMVAMVFSGVLLAQTRYESPLFLAGVAVVALLVWREQKSVQLPWLAALSPALLLPVPLLTRVFEARPGSWELASKPEYTTVFSPANIPSNLSHALVFWFDSGVEQPNAPIISALGLVAMIACLAILPRILRGWSQQGIALKVALVFGGTVLLHFAVMMCYFWGKFDDPIIHRLSLPEHILFALAPAFALALAPQRERWLNAALAVTSLALVASGLPSMAKQSATRLYYPALDTAWRREFIRVWPEKDFLFIDQDSTIWITHQVSATPVQQARNHPEALAFNLRNRMFSGIYVFQRFDIDEPTGKLKIKPDDDLGPAYELEPIAERSFRLDQLSRISRVVAISPKEGERVVAGPILPGTSEKLPSRDARENALLGEWLKKLP